MHDDLYDFETFEVKKSALPSRWELEAFLCELCRPRTHRSRYYIKYLLLLSP